MHGGKDTCMDGRHMQRARMWRTGAEQANVGFKAAWVERAREATHDYAAHMEGGHGPMVEAEGWV